MTEIVEPGTFTGDIVYEQCCMELRWNRGVLQQRYLVHYRGNRGISRVVKEWRDVPVVGFP